MKSNMLTVRTLFLNSPWEISLTWSIVLIETALIAIVPLMIGKSIDGLLSDNWAPLWMMSAILFILVVLAVFRRIYDTRIYSPLKAKLGVEVNKRHSNKSVSIRNARINMSRELVEFLEDSLPFIITSAVQIIITLIILYSFDTSLFISSVVITLVVCLAYALFHTSFYKINKKINTISENQVSVLSARKGLTAHLQALKRSEIKLSDSEAILYGLIFIFLVTFLIFNLWKSTTLTGITVGIIFSIVTYSWEYIDSILVLPETLQQWSRLSEIQSRINNTA